MIISCQISTWLQAEKAAAAAAAAAREEEERRAQLREVEFHALPLPPSYGR